jgi:hypothetical protein
MRQDQPPRYRSSREDPSRRRERNRYEPYVPSERDIKRYLNLKGTSRESRSFEEYFFRDNQGPPTVGRDEGRQRLPVLSNGKVARRVPQKFIPCSPSLEQRDDSSLSRSVSQNESSASKSIAPNDTWQMKDQSRKRPFISDRFESKLPHPILPPNSPVIQSCPLGPYLDPDDPMDADVRSEDLVEDDGFVEQFGVTECHNSGDEPMDTPNYVSDFVSNEDDFRDPSLGGCYGPDASVDDAINGLPTSETLAGLIPRGHVGMDSNEVVSVNTRIDEEEGSMGAGDPMNGDNDSVGGDIMRAGNIFASVEEEPAGIHHSFPDDYLQSNSSKEDKIISECIKTSQVKPKVYYHDIFRLALNRQQATQNNTRFIIECFSRPVADEKSSKNFQPLETPGVDKVLSVERGDIGCYLWHRTLNKLHYDKTEQEWPKFKEAAERKDIAIIEFPPDGKLKVFQDAGQQFVILNGADPSGLVERICLEEIFEDVLCDSGKATEIALPGKRFNRGVPIGISGCQSSEKKTSRVALAQPNVIKGTSRYPNSFGRMTSCALDLIKQAKCFLAGSADQSESEKATNVGRLDGLFKNHDDFYNSHMSEWANKCSDGATDSEINLLQSLSWNCYVHDKQYVDPRIKNVLLPHVDSENPLEPSHDVLIGVWQKVYSRRLGRYVTLSCTGALRKSCEYLLNRDLLVKKMAYTLVNRANNLPSHQRWIEKDSFCPAGMGHVVVPIHLHTTFHLSAVTGPVTELREWLWRTQNKVMSYYLAEEMCFAFLDTNNSFRFYSFVRQFIDDYKRTGVIPLKNDETFLGECEAYMTRTFGGWNGSKDPSDGRDQGATRYQCATNFPRAKHTNLMGLRHSERIKKKYKDKPVSRSVFEAAQKEVRETVVGKGELLSSKLLYLDAILGMHLPAEWLDQCVMGSSKTLDRLKKEDDGFKAKYQSTMLYDCMRKIGDERGRIPRSKCEETGCVTLKSEETQGMDIAFENQELHWPEIVNGTVVVKRMSHLTDYQAVDLVRGQFSYGKDAHYYPRWANLKLSLLAIAGTEVTISAPPNYDFKKGKPITTAAQRKRLVDKPPIGRNFKIHHIQSLIQESNYMVIRYPMKFLSVFLRLKEQRLLDGIMIRKTSYGSRAGYIGELDSEVAHSIPFTEPFKQIRQMPGNQRPPYCAGAVHKDKYNYKCAKSAVAAMQVHLMFNVHLQGCQHWATTAMQHKKDLLVLMPVDPSRKEVCHAVGVLYRHKTEILFRFAKECGTKSSPFHVAHDSSVGSMEDMLT